jgi:hypothetical protein
MANNIKTNPSLNLKKIVPIIIIVLIFIISYRTIQLLRRVRDVNNRQPEVSQQPNAQETSTIDQDTATWQTFEQEDDNTGVGTPGFTIKYPKTLIRNKDNALVSPQLNKDGNPVVSISMNSDAVRSLVQNPDEIYQLPAGIATVQDYVLSDDYRYRIVYVSNQRYVYSFTLMGKNEDTKLYEETFDTMLTTLTFHTTTISTE